jgi:tetratricopeptide (TPR) repeat protein
MKRTLLLIAALALLLTPLASCSKPAQPLTAAELLDLGEKYLLELDYEQAIVQFTKLIEIEPKNSRAYTGLAEAYTALGRTDKAIGILEQGLTQLPGNVEIQAMLDRLRPTELPMPETDVVVFFEDAIFEQMIRLGLNKPIGDILQSELDDIRSLVILGVTHCFVNDFDYTSWGWKQQSDTLIAFYVIHNEDGQLTEYKQRGNLSNIADITKLRNLNRIAIIANHISDLSPLLDLKELPPYSCNFFANEIADTKLLERFVGGDVPQEQFIEIGDTVARIENVVDYP